MNEYLRNLKKSGKLDEIRRENEKEQSRVYERVHADDVDVPAQKRFNSSTTSIKSTTRFDSTAKRNNNYKSTAPVKTESAFAVEETAPASIKKASGQKAGFERFESRNNNTEKSNAFNSNNLLDNNATPSQKQSFLESAKTNAVTKTKNIAASKRQQKTNAQRDDEVDKLIDEKFGKGTAEKLKLENPVEFQKRVAEVAGKKVDDIFEPSLIVNQNTVTMDSKGNLQLPKIPKNQFEYKDGNIVDTKVTKLLEDSKKYNKIVSNERLDSDTVNKVNEFKFAETAKRMSDDELKKALDTSANPNYRQVIDGTPQYEDNDRGERLTYWNELNNRRYNNLDSTLKQSIIEYSENSNADLRQNIKKALSENYTYTDDEINDLLDWSIGNYTPGTQEAQYEKNHPIIASAESVISNLFNGIPASIAITGAAIDKATCDLFGIDYDEKAKQEAIDKASVFLNTANRIRSNISKDLELNYSANILGVNLASFGYNTFMSIADNVARMVTGAAIGTGGSAVTLSLMATNAGSSYAINTLNNGGNIYQAISMGVISGALEWFTEKIPLESLKLLKEQGGRTVKTMVKNTFKQMAVEGTEEGVSNIGDAVADYLINGENSEYNRNFNEFKKQGYSDEVAHQKCFEMLGLSFAQDVAGGIVSGGVLGGGAVGISNAANRSSYQSMGRELKAKTDSAVKDGAETTPIDELRAVADQYGVKYKKAAERMSDVALGKFKSDVYDKVNEKGKQEIINAYAARIKELDGDSPLKAKNSSMLMRAADRVANDRNYKALGEIVAKASVGAELTKTEKARLNSNAAAKQVLYEVETVTHGKKIIRPVDIDSLYSDELKISAAANMAQYAAKQYAKGSAEYRNLNKVADELSGDNERLSNTAAEYLSIADTAVKLLRQEQVSNEQYNKLMQSREGLQVFSDLQKLFVANVVSFSDDMSEEERMRFICNSYDPTDPRYAWLNKVSEAVKKADSAYDRMSNTNYLYNKIFGGEQSDNNNGSMSGTAGTDNNADDSLFAEYTDGLLDNGRAALSQNATSVNYANDEQKQIYADRMKRAYNNAMNGYSLQRVIDEGKFNGLSEKQARAAYDAGRADRALKVKQLDDALNSRRGAARIRSGMLYISDEQLGMLNDVGNRHLQALEAVSAAIGLDIRIVTDKEASDLMMSNKAKGMYSVSKDCIYIPIDSLNNTTQSVLYTVGHEVTHFMQDYSPAAYEDLRNYVIEHINKAAENGGADIAQQIGSKVRFYEAMGQSLTEEQALDEIVAEYFCDMLDNNELIGQMAAENLNLFERVCKALSDFIERIRNTLHELMNDPRLKRDVQKYRGVADLDSDFAEMQALWNTALEQAVAAHSQVDGEVNNENVGGDRYSVANDSVYQKYCDTIEQIESSDDVSKKGQFIEVTQQTPKIIVDEAKAKDLPMAIQFDSAYLETRHDGEIKGHYHNLGANLMKKLPVLLESPECIVKTYNNRINIIVNVETHKGKHMLVSVELNQFKQVNSKLQQYNLIITAFGAKSSYLKKIITNPDNEIIYKRKTEPQGTDQLYKWLAGINDSVFDNSISPKDSVVNRNYAQNSENNTNSVDEGKYSFGDEDEQYLLAVENGDTETAQRLVDEAAKRAGYDIKAYHGTTNQEEKSVWNSKTRTYDTTYTPIRVFKKQYDEQAGHFFNDDIDNAGGYGSYLYSVYLKIDNPLIIDCNGQNYSAISYDGKEMDTYEWADYAKKNRYDGVIFKNISDGVDYNDLSKLTTDYVVFYSNQIKSADAVVYDDNGNVIPLSERFDSRKKDIRYSFGDEDEQLLDELDWTEDLNGNKRKSGYGEDVKQRINNINRYAESEAQARESADMLDIPDDKRKGESKVARAKSDAAIKIGNASKDEINPNPSKIERQNSQLKFENTELKRQMKPGVYAKGVKSGSVLEIAKSLVKNTKLSAYDIARQLNTAYKNISLNYGKVNDSTRRYLQSIAETIYYNASIKQAGNEFEDIKAILKSGTMTLAPQDRADMGDYNAFRQQYQNSLGLRNEGGTPVDSKYQELNELFPYLFPDSISAPADQLLRIAQVYDEQKPTMVNPYDEYGNKDGIINELVEQFIRDYNEKAAADPTFVDKAIEAVNKEKARLNEEYQKRVAENKEDYLKRALEDDIKKKEQYRLYREERQKTQTKQQIRRLATRLDKYLVDQTKRAYVPKEMYEPVAEIVKMLDLSLSSSDETSKYNEGLRNSFELISKLQNVFTDIKNSGLVLAGDTEAVDMMKANLDELQKTFVDEQGNAVNINALDLKQLSDVYTILRDVTGIIRDSVHDIAVKDAKAFIESADEFSNQQMSIPKKDKKAVKNDMFGFKLMSPVRFAKMMDGYNINGEMSRRVEQLAVGQREAAKWRMMAYKLFDDYENGKKADWYYKAGSEKIETHMLGLEGEKVELTKMQIMQLIMSYEREVKNEKLNHLMRRQKPKVGENSTGGAILFDSAEWNKGHYDKAVQKAVRIGRLTDGDIAKLKGLLDDESVRFMDICKNFFANISAPDVNKVTLLMHKGMPAIEESYVPFVVDKLYVHKSDISAADAEQFQTIEGSGFLKSITPNASQPLDIMGLDVLVKQHIEQAAKVVGLAIPIRNFNNFYNCKTNISFDGAEQTVESIIQRNWGKKGNEAIKQMIADLQRPRTFRDGAFNTIRDLMVNNALTGNISVVIKQAPSYFTAGDEISAKSLAKASPTFLQRFSAKYYKSLCDEIDAHTATHYERRKGMSTQELGDIASAVTVLTDLSNKLKHSDNAAVNIASNTLSKLSPAKWIQGMDCLTTAALWNAAKYEVQNLNKGIDTNSKLYWDKVTELYDRTIENTQPMYDVLHKTEMAKTESTFKKSVFMFMTQPLQNYGILRQRLGELKYAMRTGEGKAAAKRNFAKAAVSQFASLSCFCLMTMAAAFLTHRVNPYREDEGEDKGKLTAKSVWLQFGSDMLKNGLNLFVPAVGSNLYEFGTAVYDKMRGKDNSHYFELDDNVISFANEYFNLVTDTVDVISKVVSENNEENRSKLYEQGIDDIKKMAALLRIPAENLSKIFNGVRLYIQDAMSGNVFGYNAGYNMPYGEYDMLGNDDDAIYIRKEADRLSETLGNDINLEGAAEKSVTVNGESKKLSRDEYEQYSKAKGDYCKQLLLKVMKSGTYGQLPDGLKAAAVNEAKSLGGMMAKGEAIDGYSSDNYERAKALEQYGVPLEDQILSKIAIATSDDEESTDAITKAKFENKKELDSNGDGSVTNKEKIAAIEKLNISDSVKQLLIAYYKANSKKKKELIGMSGEE